MLNGVENVKKFEYCKFGNFREGFIFVKLRIFSQTKAKKTFNHSGGHKMIWIILKIEQDILMLSVVFKFPYVPFEIPRVRE